MKDFEPTNGRELVAAGRLTALRGRVEITDREIIEMSARKQSEVDDTLHRIVEANPHLLFTSTRDLLRDVTLIEWEPREPEIVREELTCEECNGSGMVAYGRWGSRPPRKTCEACDGTGVAR